jgi:hypothetical protein
MINTEESVPDLGLNTGDPDVRAFNLGVPFLSPSYNLALLKYLSPFINCYIILYLIHYFG